MQLQKHETLDSINLCAMTCYTPLEVHSALDGLFSGPIRKPDHYLAALYGFIERLESLNPEHFAEQLLELAANMQARGEPVRIAADALAWAATAAKGMNSEHALQFRLEQAQQVLVEYGCVKDENGNWVLPESA